MPYKDPKDPRRAASRRAWKKRNPEALKAQYRRKYARDRDQLIAKSKERQSRTHVDWARVRWQSARQAESRRGVPDHERLARADMLVIADEITKGFRGIPYDLSPGKPHPMTPSLSRVDHNNPRYTNNFVVEPWFLNAARQAFRPDDLSAAVQALDAAHTAGLAGFFQPEKPENT